MHQEDVFVKNKKTDEVFNMAEYDETDWDVTYPLNDYELISSQYDFDDDIVRDALDGLEYSDYYSAIYDVVVNGMEERGLDADEVDDLYFNHLHGGLFASYSREELLEMLNS